jgi:hypothetical protein
MDLLLLDMAHCGVLQERGAPDELAKTIMVEALIHFGQVRTRRRRSSGRRHTPAAVVCIER